MTAEQLATLAWRAKPHIDRYHYPEARSQLEERLRPALVPITEPHRSHLDRIVDDLVDQISFFS
jgi:hypothetical protein